MPGWVENLKPAAPARVHLMLAGLLWLTVGATLLLVGTRWTWQVRGPGTWALLVLALAVGAFKSRFVLDGAARRISGRIIARGDGRCVGGFLSLGSWVFVAAMAGAGRWLRAGVLSRHLVGLLYVAVGFALVLSSRLLLRSWRASVRRRREGRDNGSPYEEETS